MTECHNARGYSSRYMPIDSHVMLLPKLVYIPTVAKSISLVYVSKSMSLYVLFIVNFSGVSNLYGKIEG